MPQEVGGGWDILSVLLYCKLCYRKQTSFRRKSKNSQNQNIFQQLKAAQWFIQQARWVHNTYKEKDKDLSPNLPVLKPKCGLFPCPGNFSDGITPTSCVLGVLAGNIELLQQLENPISTDSPSHVPGLGPWSNTTPLQLFSTQTILSFIPRSGNPNYLLFPNTWWINTNPAVTTYFLLFWSEPVSRVDCVVF